MKCEMANTTLVNARLTLWPIDVSHQDSTSPRSEALGPFSESKPMETTMQKTVLTIFGALLISGSAVQMAAASEHHHVTKANFSRHHAVDFRGAYNQVRPINVSVTPPALLPHDTDFRRFDPSWIGDKDPSLNPAD